MSLLLVAVLLFSISSSSVSSHQYYVSDNCSSVTHSPCHSLSVYLEDESIQYNDSVFYFVGTNLYDGNMQFFIAKNVTWQGVDQFSIVECLDSSTFEFFVWYCFNILNLSFQGCGLYFWGSYDVSISYISMTRSFIEIESTRKVFISNSTLSQLDYLYLKNGFNIKIASTVMTGGGYNVLKFVYSPPIQCNSKLKNYSLELINVSMHNMCIRAIFNHSFSYSLSVHIKNVIVNGMNLTINSKSLQQIQISNTSSFGATFGGFVARFYESQPDTTCDISNVQQQRYIVVKNCRFYKNRYGLFTFSSKCKTIDFFIEECLIYNNIIGFGTLESENITILNTKVNNNERNLLVYSEVFLRNVSITNTLSSGLTLKRSTVVVGDSLFIFNNTGTNGGGLAMYDESNIKLLPECQMNIVSNHATKKGGGIYTNNLITCPFHSDSNLSITHLDINVSNNSADLAGQDFYGYIFKDNCPHYFNEGTKSAGTPNTICFCDPNNASINYIVDNCPVDMNILDKQAFPGQKLNFDIIMIDLEDSYTRDSVTAGDVKIYLDNNKLLGRQSLQENCSSVEIILQANYGLHKIKFLLYREVDGFSIADIQDLLFDVSLDFDVFINECPIGFSVNDSSECDCSQSVYRQNVTCDINTQSITHNGLLWIGTYDTSTPFNANATNPNACIVNEDCLLYCSPNPVTFQLNDTDTQCVDNRGQRMCGSCRNGYSLLMGSNKCGRCDDTNNYIIITWLLLFAVMGVSLVFLLIALNLTVSVGTLNGLLFYANIVKLYEPVFSREGALPVLNQVISWINLDFGFKACLYNGMDSYAKQWLQFAFPLYLWVIIIIIIQLCRRYGKISRLMGSHAVPVLSTLFLLSYTKLVRTIVIVVHKREVTLHYSNESVRSVSLWYEDPNVEYAKGKHAVLLGFALLVGVLFVIPYTLFLLVNPFYEKHLSNYKLLKKFWNRFKPIIDAYSGPMRDEYRFWPGLLLVARIPVLLSVTLVDSFIQSQHFLLSMLLTVLAIILSLGYCFGGFYLKKRNNIIETWFLFNLCIMIALSVTLTDESKVLIWYNACLSVFIFSFILIVVYHLYLQLSCTRWYDALIKKLFKKQDEDDDPLLDVTESHKTVDQQRREIIPSSTDVRRRASCESVVDLY